MRVKGFTLVELVVTVALTAIVLAFAVPAFTELVRSNRLTTQTNEFITALVLARSEAVRRGSPVWVAATGGVWTSGWKVMAGSFVEGDDRDDAATYELIRQFDALTGAGGLASAVSDVKAVVFDANGAAQAYKKGAGAGAYLDGACFTLTHGAGYTKTVDVGAIGHVESSTDGCGG